MPKKINIGIELEENHDLDDVYIFLNDFILCDLNRHKDIKEAEIEGTEDKRMYTAVCFYKDSGQPYTSFFCVADPQEIIKLLPEGLMLVEVFEGAHRSRLLNEEIMYSGE